jgi:hypothetical protein
MYDKSEELAMGSVLVVDLKGDRTRRGGFASKMTIYLGYSGGSSC